MMPKITLSLTGLTADAAPVERESHAAHTPKAVRAWLVKVGVSHLDG